MTPGIDLSSLSDAELLSQGRKLWALGVRRGHLARLFVTEALRRDWHKPAHGSEPIKVTVVPL